MLFSFIHIYNFSTTNQTYIMIILIIFKIIDNLVILFFLDLNIIFNLSHPSNHSQTLTKSSHFSPLIPLKWTRQASHSNPLELIISLSLQSTLTERGEGRWKFLYFWTVSVMQWFEGDLKITIMSAIYFSA